MRGGVHQYHPPRLFQPREHYLQKNMFSCAKGIHPIGGLHCERGSCQYHVTSISLNTSELWHAFLRITTTKRPSKLKQTYDLALCQSYFKDTLVEYRTKTGAYYILLETYRTGTSVSYRHLLTPLPPTQ